MENLKTRKLRWNKLTRTGINPQVITDCINKRELRYSKNIMECNSYLFY